MKLRLRASTALLVLCAGFAAQAQERLPIRLDNWAYFQRNTDDSERWQYRLRFYVPVDLGSGWTLTQRADLPFYYTNRTGPENPDGGWKAGVGDWYIDEGFATPPLAENLRGNLGARFVFPTGGLSPFGSGQYQWAPSAGFGWDIPEAGLRVAPLARYFMSFHANEVGAGKVRRLDLFPGVNKGVGEGWTIRFYDENAISYNQITKKWFVPIDLQLVRRARKDLELMIGGAYGMVRDDPQYLSQVYARVTFYF